MAAQQFVAERERQPGYTHVVLITTGSVASIKAPLIVSELLQVRSVQTHAHCPALTMTSSA